jgi:ABC-2 type transport system permease protein
VELDLANPLAEAVLLIQRCFWVGVTEDPAQTALVHMPDHLFTRGLIQLACCLVFLLIAQMVFTKLERKFPERL